MVGLRLTLIIVLLASAASLLAAPAPISQVDIAMKGAELNAMQADSLEQSLMTNPKDLNARIKLLGFYLNKKFESGAGRNWQRHALWVVQNKPEAEIAGTTFVQLDPVLDGQVYEKAKETWLKQIKAKPKDKAILANAASFFSVSDSNLSEQFLTKLKALDPKNPTWPRQVGDLYMARLGVTPLSSRPPIAAKALVQYEKAVLLATSGQAKMAILPKAAKAAFEAGDMKKASAYATQLLDLAAKYKDAREYGDAVHKGNIILGRVALRSGNVQKAKDCLVAAGKTPGSTTLNSFGPSMTLAKELLDKGEKECVQQYLDLCASFWEMGTIELSKWKKSIDEGKTPEFAGNLDY